MFKLPAFFGGLLGLILAIAHPVFASEAEIRTNTLLRLEKMDRPATPNLAPASSEAELAIKRFKLPDGFEVFTFAAEPMLGNPVALCLDEQGRVFVSETYRYRSSVLDIRHYMPMLEADLACRTVEDRLEMTERFFGAEAKQIAVESEIIRLLEDRDGDGKADISSIYADDFDSALDGIASGVLAHRGKVWFANIPEITLLEGMDSKGRAKSRRTFSHGYGVRYSYTGHDLHGLILGPDGRLYFSFGDRGATVKTKEGKLLAFPDEGAVFRCNPDGTEMEVIHRGLRNPQELAFDEFGNLFTGDNDFDHGDKERWVYVVEGGDSGWRVGYQHPPMGYDSVPWKSDKLWTPHFEGQAAYIVPPIANLDDGPSGLVYYPGTGLPAEYNGRFFLCQFKGNISRSGITSFAVEPDGASFRLVDSKPFLWNVQVTDVDFGPDSHLYFSDWGEGWQKNDKGRIFRVAATNALTDPIVRETQKLMAEGFAGKSQKELLSLLAHPNMRVRLEAQYTLAGQGKKNLKALGALTKNKSAKAVARRHAIWALGQIGRSGVEDASKSLVILLSDADAEMRAQAAKVLGDIPARGVAVRLIPLLKDPSERVRFFAAQSLGRLKSPEAVHRLIEMLRANNDQDVYLRHAGVVALSRSANPSELLKTSQDSSASVRLAVVLAMRQLKRPEISRFLEDENTLIVAEAARAINDAEIDHATPQLAAFLSGKRSFPSSYKSQKEAIQLRAVNANFRLGESANAKALAAFLVEEASDEVAVVEALNVLGLWAEPGQRDRIVGTYRPLKQKRDSQIAAEALAPVLPQMIEGKKSDKIKMAAIKAVGKLDLQSGADPLKEFFANGKNPDKLRLEALKVLADLNGANLSEVIKLAQADSSELIRKEGNRMATQASPDTAVAQIRAALSNGSIPEKQGALVSLASLTGPSAQNLLSEQLDLFMDDKLPPELELELFQAVAARPPLKQKLQRYLSGPGNKSNIFRETLFGGNAEAGKKIFMERPEASCVRCHKLDGEGGEAGPDLARIGHEKSRAYLLESLVKPNAQIAPGFETLLVIMKSGASYAGVFKSENETELVINSPEDGVMTIPKADIQSRDRGASGMPEGLGEILSRRDLRDLVEFLATLK